jgi:hypothetical protein
MKAVVFLGLFACGPILAFDPAGAPPERTMEWTTRSLANVRIPHIDLEDVAMIDALVFASRIDVPKDYRVWVKYPDEMKKSDLRVTFKAKDISWMELLGTIAARSAMDLRIQPGVVTFVPRSESGTPANKGKSATPPQPEKMPPEKPAE